MTALRDHAAQRLSALELSLNIPQGERAPHIVNITLPNIKSETMLHFLSSREICVSSGSACSSHSGKTSRALIAFGLTEREADCTIRVSMGEYNTKDDIDALVSALKKGRETLIRMR
jgi:cysteine desulfurase